MSISAAACPARPVLGSFSLLVSSRAGELLCGAPEVRACASRRSGPRPAQGKASKPPGTDAARLNRSGFEALAAVALASAAMAPIWIAGPGAGRDAQNPGPGTPPPDKARAADANAFGSDKSASGPLASAPEQPAEAFAACRRGPDEPSQMARNASTKRKGAASAELRLASKAPKGAKASAAPAEPPPKMEFAVEAGWAMPTLGSAAEAAFKAKLSEADGSGRYAKLARAAREHAEDKPNGWGEMAASVRSALEEKGEAAALALANAMVNKVPYVDGTDGSYFSPTRFFRRGGVCKDYAVAKYLLLVDAGFDPDKLRVASMGPLKAGNPWHVVLLAKPAAAKEILVLDMNPRWFALQDLAASKETKQMRVRRLAETGVSVQDVEKDASAVYALSKYPGARRGLGWVGNLRGGASGFLSGPGKDLAGSCEAPLWSDASKPGSEVCESQGRLWLSEASEGKVKILRKIDRAELDKLLASARAKHAASADAGPAPTQN